MATFAGFATLGSVLFTIAGVVLLVLIAVLARRPRDGEPLDADADDDQGDEPAEAGLPARQLPRGYAVVLGCFAMAAVLGVLGVVVRPDPVARVVGRVQALERRLNAAEVELDTLSSAAAALGTVGKRSAAPAPAPADKRSDGASPGPVDRRSAAAAPGPVDDSSPAAAPAPIDRRLPARRPEPARTEPAPPPPVAEAPRPVRDTKPPTAPAATSPATANAGSEQTVGYHSPRRLQDVRKGQAKDVVFGLFGTEFEKRDGKLIEIRGMRLMPIEKSPSATRFEVSRVTLGQDHGSETSYWFLFEAGRLLTWGRQEEWKATAGRYTPDLPEQLQF